MKILTNLKKQFSFSRKRRGQVFILATLIIVVYTVSMIAVVTELSVNRTQTDQIDLPHLVDEYLSEMNYQLQICLYNYTRNPTYTQTDIINSLESFISIFSIYATSKGVGASINLRLNEFTITASRMGNPSIIPLGTDFNQTTFISVNSSILFQSSDSGSKISGIFNHYYGINLFVSTTNPNTVMVTQRNPYGNIINYLSGAVFTNPSPTMTDNNNGNYTSSTSLFSQQLNLTLSTGLIIVS